MSEPPFVTRAGFQALLLTVEGLQQKVNALEGQGAQSAAASVSSFEVITPTAEEPSVAEAALTLPAEGLEATQLIAA